MNAKVHQYGAYPRHNQIIVHLIEIEQLNENVYYHVISKDESAPQNDLLGIILQIAGNFFEIDQCSRQVLDTPQNIELANKIAKDYETFVNSKIKENRHVSLMDIKVYEKLGKDTAPLFQYREQRERAQQAAREEQERKREEKKQQEIELEKQRLASVKQKYIAGEEIDGEDFVSICKKDGLNIHIRTIGTLYKSIASLTKNGTIHIWKKRGKATPKTEGVYKLIKEYNSFLENKDEELKTKNNPG